jgi:redox-sensing transcriptional repressor
MKKIPKAVAKRLPVYYHGLIMLRNNGVDKMLSSEMEEFFNIPSTTIRRDLSCLGELGKQGYGYQIENVISVLSKELNAEPHTALLIGVGKLGQALINYNGVGHHDVTIVKAFDINEDVVGKSIGCDFGCIRVEHMDRLEEMYEGETIAIVTVPSANAKDVFKRIEKLDIRGVLNFTGVRMKSERKNISVQEVDLSSELQTLVYFIQLNEKENE